MKDRLQEVPPIRPTITEKVAEELSVRVFVGAVILISAANTVFEKAQSLPRRLRQGPSEKFK